MEREGADNFRQGGAVKLGVSRGKKFRVIKKIIKIVFKERVRYHGF